MQTDTVQSFFCTLNLLCIFFFKETVDRNMSEAREGRLSLTGTQVGSRARAVPLSWHRLARGEMSDAKHDGFRTSCTLHFTFTFQRMVDCCLERCRSYIFYLSLFLSC